MNRRVVWGVAEGLTLLTNATGGMLLCCVFVFCAQKIVSTLFWLPVFACFQNFAPNFKIRPLSGHQIFQLTQSWWCVIEISVSTPCKILIWGGLGGEEWAWRDLAKNFATKFSDWLNRVLLTTSRVLFRSAPDENFRTSGETPIRTIEILVPESRLTPEILSRRYSDLDDWRTRNLCSF